MSHKIKIYMLKMTYDECVSKREGLPAPFSHVGPTKHPRVCLIASLDQAIDLAVLVQEVARREDSGAAWHTLEQIEIGIRGSCD
jgi:hypothetical protein